MAPLIAFAFAAGVLTILSPCTLPLVPAMLGSARSDRNLRLYGLAAGFALAFLGTTVILASVLAAAGATTTLLRLPAAVLVGLAGATLALPTLAWRLEQRLAPLVQLGSRAGRGTQRRGLTGGFLLGGALGLIWAPCAGPIMAAVLASAIVAGPSPATVLIATAYVLGALVPLVLIAIGGRRAIARVADPRRQATVRRSFGVVMVVAAALVATGLDVPLQVGVANLLPAGLSTAVTSVETGPLVQQELTTLRAVAPPQSAPAQPPSRTGEPAVTLPQPIAVDLPASVALDDLGPAPELAGIAGWLNSPPLTLASLRGRVVLVHFWTFECINCLHVQPHVKAWYERYADAGFVVIGVHTPELSFERDAANVGAALASDGVRFPVALDPGFATWNAYANQYWPAFYFVDKAGQIRHVHFGEGDYAGSEQVIRELLAEPALG